MTPAWREKLSVDYDPFAWAYNQYWSRPFSIQVMTALDTLLLPHLPEPARLLDLCCGTGQLAAELTTRGVMVTGVDGSFEMLRYARQNAPLADFVQADIRNFHGQKSFDAAVSIFDSLNHVMSLAELVTVFVNVRAALAPGGLFLFDLNMEEGYVERCRGSHVIVDKDNVCIVDADYLEEERLGMFGITLFRREGPAWNRTDVTLLQRCYSEAQVLDALGDAGFSEVSVHDADIELGMDGNVGRSFFRARMI